MGSKQKMEESMKHNNIIIIFTLALVISLTGCVNTNKLSEYDMTGISFIEYTDIDTVCEDKELITAGSNLLSDQEDNLLLSYVVDSAIELSAEIMTIWCLQIPNGLKTLAILAN